MASSSGKHCIDTAGRLAEQILLRGRIQGIGARPAIFRLAAELGVVGEVRNSSQGLEIQVEGTQPQMEAFKLRLRSQLPKEADVTGVVHREIPLTAATQFTITQDEACAAIVTSVPLDVAVCRECLAEVHSPENRRFHYPFNSCVRCGPRYSIIHRMPFERADTAMVHFPCCEECLSEYRSSGDRRFHAQAISCPRCGPRLWSVDSNGGVCADQTTTIRLAEQALLSGQIVAVKGLGGYQLLVDATNSQAVQRLRQRKGRVGKPLAVMVRTLGKADQIATLNGAERQALASAANPIVLLQAKVNSGIAPSVYPGLDTIGVLLPTTPLHDLLLQHTERPLVCTSGNLEGQPLVFEEDEAETELADLCDMWLHHNRPIVRPIDDSVVRVIQGKCVSLRLARGMAPWRLPLSGPDTALALGGQMKSAAAWTHSGSAFLGPHIGDLASLATQERYQWHLADWQSLYRFSPSRVICDQHPDYFTSQTAKQKFAEMQAVQHHHAHVASAILENQLKGQTVLGVAWDGTGYARDGTVWGGEFLIVAGNQCERFASLRPFTIPGGEAAIYEPWRIALSLLTQIDPVETISGIDLFEGKHSQIALLKKISNDPRFSPATTSAGRLLDGVASLILRRTASEYEGQLPMMLEAVADPTETDAYHLAMDEQVVIELDWRPLVRQLLEDLASNISPGRMAMKVHRGLANGIIAVCLRRPDLAVVLTGGVFQNRLLAEMVANLGSSRQEPIYLPGTIPPGDGGLAAGQLTLALDW